MLSAEVWNSVFRRKLIPRVAVGRPQDFESFELLWSCCRVSVQQLEIGIEFSYSATLLLLELEIEIRAELNSALSALLPTTTIKSALHSLRQASRCNVQQVTS